MQCCKEYGVLTPKKSACAQNRQRSGRKKKHQLFSSSCCFAESRTYRKLVLPLSFVSRYFFNVFFHASVVSQEKPSRGQGKSPNQQADRGTEAMIRAGFAAAKQRLRGLQRCKGQRIMKGETGRWNQKNMSRETGLEVKGLEF